MAKAMNKIAAEVRIMDVTRTLPED
jgi:hypothetical protein